MITFSCLGMPAFWLQAEHLTLRWSIDIQLHRAFVRGLNILRRIVAGILGAPRVRLELRLAAMRLLPLVISSTWIANVCLTHPEF